MDVIEKQPKQRREVSERLAKPLRACFKNEQEAKSEWEAQDTDSLVEVGVIKTDMTFRPSRKVIEEFSLHVGQIRRAQQQGQHITALRLTTKALRTIRQQPKYRRRFLHRQIQELLNLRSVSLISVGECGEAWRCITLMSKLW